MYRSVRVREPWHNAKRQSHHDLSFRLIDDILNDEGRFDSNPLTQSFDRKVTQGFTELRVNPQPVIDFFRRSLNFFLEIGIGNAR